MTSQPQTKLSKTAKAEKVRIAYWMVEQHYPLTAELTILRGAVKRDGQRLRATGSYNVGAATVAASVEA